MAKSMALRATVHCLKAMTGQRRSDQDFNSFNINEISLCRYGHG
jgi:hypothetical protein